MWSPPQGAETKVVNSHREAAVGITAQQSGLPLAALHPLALWKRQQCGRPRKVRRRKSLTATRKRPSASQRSNRDYRLQHSIRWRFGNANHIVAPQDAEAKVVDSHQEQPSSHRVRFQPQRA